MGEVYVAEDTRLNRKVAIKVLSGLMAADPERRQRFEREARAIAALNHPNIVTIHSVEEADGVPFLTMELVEGRPLSDVIPAGGLPLDAMLRVGIGVSDAMAAAHERGITHRDLKPANVMVTKDGRVKVLDFGLAKLQEPEAAPGDQVTQLPTGDLTGEGRILGTVAYMSPEQAEGKPVDPRSDIFSLGVMLHEIATGDRPFKGDTNVSVISSILKDTPASISDLNPRLPAGFAKIVRRALAKEPSRRYQTAIDLRNELEDLKQEVDSGVTATTMSPRPSAAPRRTRSLVYGTVGAAVILVALAGYLLKRPRTDDSAAPRVFELDRFTRVTNTGHAQYAAVSPDARYVAHIKFDGSRPALWVRQTATTSDVQIVAPAAVRFDGITFAPDGNYVYYVTYEITGGVGTLYRVPVLGGAPQRIVEDVDSPIAFSPDHKQFAFMRGAPAAGKSFVMVAAADGSGVRQLAESKGDLFQLTAPAWSPDGRTILVSAQSLRDGPHNLCYAVDAASGSMEPIGGRWGFTNDIAWMPDGGSFVVSAVDFNGQSPQLWQVMVPSGERRRITNDLNTYLGISISADGRSIATVQAETVASIWVTAPGDPTRASQITSGRGRADGTSGLSWTSDGRIVYSSNQSGRPQLWIVDADGGNAQQLTQLSEAAFSPEGTPDGRVVFQRHTGKSVSIGRIALDGSDMRQLTEGGTDIQPTVSPDGRWVFYNSPATGQPLPYKVSIDGGQATRLSESRFRPLGVSPDGRLLLGVAWDAKQRRSDFATLPVDGGQPTLLGMTTLGSAAWAPTGLALTYVGGESGNVDLWSKPLGSGKAGALTNFKSADTIYAFAWSRDGKRLALSRGSSFSDVVLLSAVTRPEAQ